MPSVFDIFKSQVSDDQLSQMAEKLGADKSKVQDAISMSLPALIEALGRKAEQSPPRSQSQSRASQSSNSGGSMLDMLNETIGGGSTAPAPASQRSSQSAPQQFDDILPPSSPPSNKPQQSPPAHQHQSLRSDHLRRRLRLWATSSVRFSAVELRREQRPAVPAAWPISSAICSAVNAIG